MKKKSRSNDICWKSLYYELSGHQIWSSLVKQFQGYKAFQKVYAVADAA